MPERNSITTPGLYNSLNKPWLKGTNLYFVEYALFLVLLAVVLWLFDALVFTTFGHIANSDIRAIGQPDGVPAVAATFVFVPALFVLWRRVRMEERLRPKVWLRRAHRYPVYVFVIIQALSALFIAYVIAQGLVASIVAGFDDFGRTLLAVVLPGLFALAVHVIASFIFLGKTLREERNFVSALSAGMLITAAILLVVLSINYDSAETNRPNSMFDSEQELFQDRYRSDTLRERNFFDY